MAVVSVKEKHERRRSGEKDGTVTHTRVFLVRCDAAGDGTAAALYADDGTTAIPAAGDEHPSGDGTTMKSKEAEPVGDADRVFEVTCEYEGASDEPVDNPLDEPPEVSYGAENLTEPYFLDRSDTPKPVTNSAGEPFDEYRERQASRLTIGISRNVATYSVLAMDQIGNTVNQNDVIIDGVTYAAGTLLLAPVTATRQTAKIVVNDQPQTLVYYKISFTVTARHDGWDDKLLDVGYSEKLGNATDGYKLVPIVDSVGKPVTKPWPLDGHGRKKPNPTDAPETLTFKPYKKAVWSALNF